jgi:hypothetical protein
MVDGGIECTMRVAVCRRQRLAASWLAAGGITFLPAIFREFVS